MTTLPTWLQVVYFVLLVVGVLAGWTFVIRYMVSFRWWSTELGRHLVTFSSCLAAFETYYLLVLAWPDLPGKTAIRTVLFVVLTGLVVWRLVMFERYRRQGMK
jgi:hypothetical protein